MSRNGSGVYSLPAGNPVVTGTTISSSWANTTLSDIATALTGSVASDGQTAMTGNLQMGNNKVTGLAVATTSGDALSYAQAATVSDLSVTGNATVGGTLTLTGGLTLNGNVTVGDSSSDTLTVNATSTFAAGATFSSTFAANGGVTLGDASGDALTINSSAVSIPNGLNFDSNTLVIDATNNYVGIGTASPNAKLHSYIGASSTTGVLVESPNDAAVTGEHFYAYSGRGDTSAYNLLKLSNSAGVKLVVQGNGNLGLGVTPSAWTSSSKAIQIGARSSISSEGTVTDVSLNAYTSASSVDRYIASATAARYRQQSGIHSWLTAASGTAGDVITFTQAMTLDASGNLLLGTTTTGSDGLCMTTGDNIGWVLNSGQSTATIFRQASTAALVLANGYRYSATSGGYASSYSSSWAKSAIGVGVVSGTITFYTDTAATVAAGTDVTPTERMRIDSSGNVGIGTSSTSTTAVQPCLFIGSSNTGASYNSTVRTGGYSSTAQLRYTFNHAGAGYGWGIGSSGGSDFIIGTVADYTVGSVSSEKMRIDSSGNLGLGVTPSAWSTSYKALEINGISLMGSTATNDYMSLGVNFYFNGTNWIYKSSEYATRYYQVDGTHAWYTAPSGTAGNAITFTQAMTLNASGNLALQGGTTTATGVGITFPATQSASTDANCLDDYEEGTFTPTVVGTTTAGTGTYGAQEGYYTKIGNVVTATIYILLSAHTGTGNIRISGLPFSATRTDAVDIGRLSGLALTAGYVATMYTSGTNIVIEQYPTGGGASIAVPMDAVWSVNLTVTYKV